MPEKEPQFTVTDRRKFTLDGEPRTGADSSDSTTDSGGTATTQPEAAAPASPAPAAPTTPSQAETPSSQQSTAQAGETMSAAHGPRDDNEKSAQQEYHSTTRQLDDFFRQANPGDADAPMNFDRLVQSIYMTAAFQMGAGAAPDEKARIDLMGARQSVDMLGVLEEKTRGNLTEDEKGLLQSALFELRMSFLEIANAIASSAQKPPQPGKAR